VKGGGGEGKTNKEGGERRNLSLSLVELPLERKKKRGRSYGKRKRGEERDTPRLAIVNPS